jgi:hypothetical protein
VGALREAPRPDSVTYRHHVDINVGGGAFSDRPRRQRRPRTLGALWGTPIRLLPSSSKTRRPQLDKVIYTLTNPIGLVDKADQWPGATALPSILRAKPIVAARPEHYFRGDDNGW